MKEATPNPYFLNHYLRRRTERLIDGYEDDCRTLREALEIPARNMSGMPRPTDPGDPVLRAVLRREDAAKRVEAVEEGIKIMQKKHAALWSAKKPLLMYRSYEKFSLRAMEVCRGKASGYRTWKRQRAKFRYHVAKAMGWVA